MEKELQCVNMQSLSKESEYYVLKRLQESPDRKWVLTRNSRTVLTVVVSVLHLLITLLAFVMLGLSVFNQLYVEGKVDLFDGLDISRTMTFLIVICILLCLIHGFASAFFYKFKNCTEYNKNWRGGLKLYLIIVFVLLLVVISGTFASFMLSNDIERQLHHSIFGAMKQYKRNSIIKKRIDAMQQMYHCCGGISARDWSSISWISIKYLNPNSEGVKIKVEKNQFFPNGVPFSCCSVNAKPPCIHVLGRNTDVVHPMNVYMHGCSQKLLDYFEMIFLLPVGIILIVTSMIEVALLISIRLLQTSVKSAHLLGDDFGVGYAHLMPEAFQDIWYDDA